MDKLKFETPDMVTENIDKIAALFPSAITEMRGEDGKIKRGVNFEVLKQLLSRDVVDGDEAYEFTWVGKKAAIVEANKPIRKTLRPCAAESKDWDTTENLYIEGDNLEVLKLLQESYLGKVKMIYIDPPYNTGNDFIYADDFMRSQEEENEQMGMYDEDENRLFKNTDTNGRFHSDWCSMIYSRLMLARNLLTEDGVIFISIGQAEIQNMINISNEVFGEDNHVGNISRMMKSGGNKGQYFSPNMEYILVYAKNINDLGYFREALSDDIIKTYNHVETFGEHKDEKFTIKGLCQPGLGIRPNQRYWIEAPDGSFLIPQGKNFPKRIIEGEKIFPTDEDTCWKWTPERYFEEKKKGNIYFSKNSSATALVDENGNIAKWNVFNKIWLSDREEAGRVPVDLITKWENRISSSELKELNIPFDFAKPTALIKYLISLIDKTESAIILDFFSGSATTAHAVMQLNAEDGGHRKFIMVQLPEKCDESSEAYKAGYKNICEIGKERIRRAGDKIKSEHPDAKLDTGFRVFRVDESNMEDIYYHPEELIQTMLGGMVSNIKPDRTDLDLLYACLLDWGVEISLSHTQAVIDGCTVHNVDNGALCACFDERVPLAVIDYMAKQQPLRAVFRDSSFAADDSKINVTEIFKNLSPDTKVKVI